MKYLGTVTLIIMYACLTAGTVSAQTVDERLWGRWDLDSVVLTSNRIAQKYNLPVLLADKSKLPRNMLTSLYFFEDQIGVNTTETEFVPAENVSMKGSFTTDNGKLTITMQDRTTRAFTYTVDDRTLKIWYVEGIIEFYLIYKLTFKPGE